MHEPYQCFPNPFHTIASHGKNCQISPLALIVGGENVHLGDHVRIDAFTVILASNGRLDIGNHVHISTHVHLNCGGGVVLEDHAQIATGCRLISATDDFSGEHLVGPCVPENLRHVTRKAITMKRLSVLGAGSTVLPGITIAEGSAFGAHSLVSRDSEEYWLYLGTPAKKVSRRSQNCHTLAHHLLADELGLNAVP